MFGMGTGVTLAVYSPANLGVLRNFVTFRVCSNNLNQSCKNTPLSFWGAWQGFLCSVLVNRLFDLIHEPQTGAMQPDFSQRNRLG